MGVGHPERLVDRTPRLTPAELAQRFVPPPRFARARFDTYLPSPDHPSQAVALDAMRAFASSIPGSTDGGANGKRRRRWGRRAAVDDATSPTAGRYLDGGFGVGKTHLLAAAWHEAPGPKAYLTFSKLTATVGFEGMDEAVAAFAPMRLLCLDEFELDDVAHTLMVVTFLRRLVPGGTRVAATSNALPDRLGEGRFNADDFEREIAAIAGHFEVVRIDGPDYRARNRATAVAPLQPDALRRVTAALAAEGLVTVDRFDDVLAHLRRVHPVQYGAMVEGLDAVVLDGLHPIENQGAALLFVQLVDELYDAELTVAASGCGVDELFPNAYRHGGYRKKYGRCESRLSALLEESRRLATTD